MMKNQTNLKFSHRTQIKKTMKGDQLPGITEVVQTNSPTEKN